MAWVKNASSDDENESRNTGTIRHHKRRKWCGLTQRAVFGVTLLALSFSVIIFGHLQLLQLQAPINGEKPAHPLTEKASVAVVSSSSVQETFNISLAPLGPRDRLLPYPKLDRLNDNDRALLDSIRGSTSDDDRIIHVLTHTHWDREWYMSLEEFRGSLLIELDRVFDMLKDSKSKLNHFHMDGQYIMVEDYLETRPSMRQTVADLNQRGKLTLGPFYSQPDVFLASGEALIRNLMLGMSLSSEMGGTSQVAYLADSFGFIGQLPQIIRGFGMSTFVTGRFAPKGPEGVWIGPDDSRVMYAFLANWYCHAADMLNKKNTSIQEAQTKLEMLTNSLTKQVRAKSKHLLAMSGCDHYMTSPQAGINIEIFNQAARLTNQSTKFRLPQLVQTNIDDYMELLAQDIEERNVTSIPVVVGEVREKVDDLINSASTKMSVKQKNFQIQSLLEQWVEPMEAFGWKINGRRYDSDRIWHAWKPVLQTHAHDSICSTSASSVIHDIVNRLSRSEQSVYRLIADQVGQVIPAMVEALKVGTPEENLVVAINPGVVTINPLVVIVNPTNTPRSEVVAFTILGMRQQRKRLNTSHGAIDFTGFRNLLDTTDTSVHPAILVATKVSEEESFVLPNELFRKVVWRESATYVARVHLAPNGIAVLKLISNQNTTATLPKHLSRSEASVANSILEISPTLSLENEHLRIVVSATDGSCSVEHRKSGRKWTSVNKLVRSAELGSSYKHIGSAQNQAISAMKVASRKESVAFSSIQLKGKLGASVVSITYVLFEGSRRLEIETTIENVERDNHVVACFPAQQSGSGVDKSVEVDTDGTFEYVNRNGMYRQGRYVHQNRFTSMYSAGSSLTVAVRGIPEYLATRGSLKITLIRGVNRIGDWIRGTLRDDILQELRTMTFQYAVIPDTCQVTAPSCSADIEARNFVNPIGSFASWVNDGYRPERYIDMETSPLSIVARLPRNSRSTNNTLSEEKLQLAPLGLKQMFDLRPSKLILSAVKKAESKDALVLRMYNPTAFPLEASLAPGLIEFNSCKRVRLNENDLEGGGDEEIQKGASGDFIFTVGPYKIVTFLLK